MKSVIALCGKKNVGKTTTNRLVYDSLKERSSLPPKILWKGRGTVEIRAVLMVDEVKIGVATPGDDIVEVERWLHSFVTEGCQIIVCATRTKRGKIKATIERFGRNHGYDVQWRLKFQRRDELKQEIANQEKAKELIALVEDTIKKINSEKPSAA